MTSQPFGKVEYPRNRGHCLLGIQTLFSGVIFPITASGEGTAPKSATVDVNFILNTAPLRFRYKFQYRVSPEIILQSWPAIFNTRVEQSQEVRVARCIRVRATCVR